MKKSLFLLSIITTLSTTGMQQSDVQRLISHKDTEGRTVLHFAAKCRKPCKSKDKPKAAHAALFILLGADVQDPDDFKKTPLDYADENKTTMPTLHSILLAGKCVQNFLKNIHKEKTKEEFDEYKKALEFLQEARSKR